ncbi:universal stress protein [bacterium]|nr:MAG: universal stress protein [bacterium]
MARATDLVRIWALALPIHVHGCHGVRNRPLGAGLPGRPSEPGSGGARHRRRDGPDLLAPGSVCGDPPGPARAPTLMADHAHLPTARKVLVAVGGQGIDAETVRLACRMTDPQGGRLYGVHIVEVNRSLPLGAVLDEVVERGEKILDEVEQLAAEAQLPVETELVQARDTGPALVDEAVEWGADLIVMGLPYKRRFGEFNLGKTVPYVLKNANCRVMLFREHREHPA